MGFGFSDTGQWRLIVYLSADGMKAFLKHTTDNSRPAEEVLNASWEKPERKEILKKIEETVFDNPALLDDYATDIIVETSRTVFAPMALLESEDNAEETIFSALFPGSENEVSIDSFGEVAALYSLTPGLESFISRTIPGARLRSHLAVITSYFSNRNSDAVRIYADLRDGEADLIAFDRKNLLSASSHEWETADDIVYYIMHLIQAYQLSKEEVEINISGNCNEKGEVIETLRKFCNYVVLTPLPSSGKELPLAARLLTSLNS